MGRPLKIAKAQAILTITNTTSGGVVTVTDNLTTAPTVGVTAGMPFVVATTVGGLTAGTVYYILAITGNHTFTVSSTNLSVQPQVSPSMTTAGPVSIKATVAFVDGYFNNPLGGTGYPATNSNTYSVVGGNTSIYGKQVLCNVAIGANGNGTIYSFSTSADVGGLGTDFANLSGSTGTIIQYIPANGVPTTLGYVSSNAEPNIEISNATATGNFLTTVGDATTLYANLPVTLTADIGGLTANTTYFVKAIPNSAAFTVSLTPGGANVGLSNEDATSYALQNVITLDASATETLAGASYIYATPEAGYIVRQKGKTKYLVHGTTSGLTGACYTANVANTALTPNTMTITGTYANAATIKLRNVDDHVGEIFPATVAAGSLSAGTTYTIYDTGSTIWSTVGAASDMTGTTFKASGTGSGTGTAVLANVNPDIIATFNTAYSAITAGSFVVGVTYVIVSLGNTNWGAIGAPTNAAVGTIFTATGVGSGTGTASIAGAVGPIVQVGNA